MYIGVEEIRNLKTERHHWGDDAHPGTFPIARTDGSRWEQDRDYGRKGPPPLQRNLCNSCVSLKVSVVMEQHNVSTKHLTPPVLNGPSQVHHCGAVNVSFSRCASG
ncbi:hypothetical protein AVEN_31060-1 [Araneus ventricosus]|uniref:Uncharacterized protein n=1 Tax=Araneus ventricosus TaxID=182803 RepID=A0A4Y2GF65_ARAVE|nr:hypothetical protein AVEN_31060-1 [Araneus ventricosus]